MSPRIVFRCRFGGEDGWGHVVRCSALAGAFRRRGWETLLWGTGAFDSLPRDVAESFSGESRSGREPARILFVDEMYTAQAELQELAEGWRSRNPGGVVAGIDDMQRRSMAGFDLVLNAEIGLSESTYRAGRVLLGERYALLREGFSDPTAGIAAPSVGEGVPVLVMLGGTDAFGYLPRTLAVLARIEGPSIVPIVVAGDSRGVPDALAAFSSSRLLGRVGAAELAAWMAVCRAGVFACGSSLYEAAAMQLPFVGLSVVDNQTASARKVEARWGMPICYCEAGAFPGDGLGVKLARLLAKPKRRYSEVDTDGAGRVRDALLRALPGGSLC